jgi:hypothetical protein
MVMFNARIVAYDCLDRIEWVAKTWDSDLEPGDENYVLQWLTGSMRGQGSDNPTKWLRALLEDIREGL